MTPRTAITARWARRAIVAALSGAVVLLLGEAALRLAVFSDISLLQPLRRPERYADWFADDDYWKLQHLFGSRFPAPSNPHPELGWIGRFRREDYVHFDAGQLDGRRPVLLYGDSFAACVPQSESFQQILNGDPEFSRDYFLLNYGVGGYGTDQILLLMQRTLDLYENPYVVISFMTEDLDRSILSVRTGQKPRFTLDADGAPTLADTPIEPSFEAFLQENPPRIPSYLYRLLLYSRLTPKALRSTLRGEDEIVASKIALNRAILTQMVAEVRSRQLEFCVLVFHPHIPGVSTLGGPPDWREVFLRELLADLGVDLIWSEDLLPAGGALDPSLYILANDGHPTTLFNRLIAGAMKEHVLR